MLYENALAAFAAALGDRPRLTLFGAPGGGPALAK